MKFYLHVDIICSDKLTKIAILTLLIFVNIEHFSKTLLVYLYIGTFVLHTLNDINHTFLN